jgi:hypothetical protein
MLKGEFEVLFGFWWFPPCSHCVPKKFPTMLPMYSPSSQCVPNRFPMWFPPPPPPQKKLSLNLLPPLGGATIHESLRHVELTSGIPFEGIHELGDMNRFILSANLCIQSVECLNYFLFLCWFLFFFSQRSSEVMKWPDYLYSGARTDLSSWSGSFFGMVLWSVWLMRLTPKNNFFTKFVRFMFFSSTVYRGYYYGLSPVGVVMLLFQLFIRFFCFFWRNEKGDETKLWCPDRQLFLPSLYHVFGLCL